MKALPAAVLACLLTVVVSAQVPVFTETFTQADGADPDWTSLSGSWQVFGSGYYNAALPSNVPPTISLVNSLNFTDGIVTAEVFGPMDGGLIIRANGATGGYVNAVYFIFRPNDAYFHVGTGGSVGGSLSVVGHDPLPASYRVTVQATGNTYLGTITSLDGSTVYASTSLVDSLYASGSVGVYSNTAYPTAGYDSFAATAVPEPAHAAMAVSALALGVVAVRRRLRQERPA